APRRAAFIPDVSAPSGQARLTIDPSGKLDPIAGVTAGHEQAGKVLSAGIALGHDPPAAPAGGPPVADRAVADAHATDSPALHEGLQRLLGLTVAGLPALWRVDPAKADFDPAQD